MQYKLDKSPHPLPRHVPTIYSLCRRETGSAMSHIGSAQSAGWETVGRGHMHRIRCDSTRLDSTRMSIQCWQAGGRARRNKKVNTQHHLPHPNRPAHPPASACGVLRDRKPSTLPSCPGLCVGACVCVPSVHMHLRVMGSRLHASSSSSQALDVLHPRHALFRQTRASSLSVMTMSCSHHKQ